MSRVLAALALLACLTAACGPNLPDPGLTKILDAARLGDALAVSDALEVLIAEGSDKQDHRERALDIIRAHPETTAAYAFARAAVTGRVLQKRGLITGVPLVGDVAHWADVSRKLDPAFRRGAATRLFAILCTQAPPPLLPSGCDAESGIAMLVALIKKYDDVENHLRLAEALLSQGDVASAVPELCICIQRKGELRHDEQILLETLLSDANHPTCPPTPAR
jgi:hypothetical protein